MILGDRPKQCQKFETRKFKPCDKNLCKHEEKCVPEQSWIESTCLTPLQRTGKLPDACICKNHEKRKAVTDFFIHNDTMDTLEWVDKAIENGKITSTSCFGRFSNCTTTIRTDTRTDECVTGVVIYPLSGAFPTSIPPKSAIYIRADSTRIDDPTCRWDAWAHANLRYQVQSDASSTVQIDTLRKRRSGCSRPPAKGNPTHNFDRLSSSNTSVTAAGGLSAVGTVVVPEGDSTVGSTYSVVISGSGGITCPTTCGTGTVCDPISGQCIPQTSCTDSSDCMKDWYCPPNNICTFGCTDSSDNCTSGKTCVDGKCTTGTKPNGGGTSRDTIILFVVIGIVIFIVIILGIVYFIYETNSPKT